MSKEYEEHLNYFQNNLLFREFQFLISKSPKLVPVGNLQTPVIPRLQTRVESSSISLTIKTKFNFLKLYSHYIFSGETITKICSIVNDFVDICEIIMIKCLNSNFYNISIFLAWLFEHFWFLKIC